MREPCDKAGHAARDALAVLLPRYRYESRFKRNSVT